MIECAIRWIRGNDLSHWFPHGHAHLILAGESKKEALGEDVKRSTWGAHHREVAQLRRTVEPNQGARGSRMDGRNRPVGRVWQRPPHGRTGGSIGHASEGARTAHRRPTEWGCRVGALGRSDCRNGRAGEKSRAKVRRDARRRDARRAEGAGRDARRT